MIKRQICLAVIFAILLVFALTLTVNAETDYEYDDDYYLYDSYDGITGNVYTDYIIYALIAGFGIALITVLVITALHNKRLKGLEASHYTSAPLSLSHSSDRFVSTHTSRVKKPEPQDNTQHKR